jgi:DNA uptake protein ComE-like DNA-binding protein
MSRRGGAILAVLFLMVIGIVIAASVLVSADAAGATSRAELHRTQSRALAWSGVQALMAELAEQRDGLLDGQAPEITAEWDLYTLDDGTRGGVRLIDLDPHSPAIILPENAKLDINTATAEMLARVPGLDATIGAAIVTARGSTPFTSVGQLLGVEGVTPEMLYGERADEAAPPGLGAEPPAPGGAQAGGLDRYLTVFSFDPNVQSGVGEGSDFRGKLRVNLDQSWSDKLGEAITERFGQEATDAIKQVMESGQAFKTDGELVRVLIFFNVEPEDWIEVLDVFTTSDDEFLRGRVDLGTAPTEVLACIPGITAEQAGAIVSAREGVDPAVRSSPAWPVIEGILTPEDFAEAADWLTTRSTQWRVRLEAGIDPGEGTEFDESTPMTLDQMLESWDTPAEPSLEHRVVLEAVIDVASSRPRVAYMRDITLLEPTLAMRAAVREAEEDEPFPGPEPVVGGDDPEPDPFGEIDPFLADSADFDLDIGEPGEQMPPLEHPMDLPGEGDPTDSAPPPDGQPRTPPDMIDRRIGRWTTRKAGDA